MDTGRALLDDILRHPTDDVPRLVYADWLTDRQQPGDDPRADFIRTQIALARRDPHYLLDEGMNWEVHDRSGDADVRRAADRLRLWVASEIVARRWQWPLDGVRVWRRGFAEGVRCPLRSWQEHGPQIMRAHPVTHVTATDREPAMLDDDEWHWYDGDSPRRRVPWDHRHFLPHEVWALLLCERVEGPCKLYSSRHDAVDALSRVLLVMVGGLGS